MSVNFLLFFEFLKVGLFTFGGGYASLPFLYKIVENYAWFNLEELTQLIAISGITPGPIGLNMATFAGYKTQGVLGAFISSFALIIPMLIITSQVFCLYKRFFENRFLKTVLYLLRPTSCALITSVALKLFYDLIFKGDFTFKSFDFSAFLVLLILFGFTFKFNKNPLVYILISGTLGLLIFCFKQNPF